ncbi:MAG: hypothetical protein JRI68_18845 [Deltaproteobacteria bacterium]|nr:hypothetical protein [Deltaproteobacteria bacterium]
MLDWTELDAEVQRALTSLRQAGSRLQLGQPEPDAANPVPHWLVADDHRAEVASHPDGAARELTRWLTALATEHQLWPARVALCRRWHEPQLAADRNATRSAHQARASWLTHPRRAGRDEHGAAFARVAGSLSDAHLSYLDQRGECSEATALLHVAEADATVVTAAATELLRRTDDAAQEHQRCGWAAGIHAALGRDADEGWPARLSSRWLVECFAGSGLTAGVPVDHLGAGTPWGSSSFARGLGQLGMAVLDAGRPANLPLSAHQDPWGARRHLRSALFATLPLERSFAAQVLGLGRDRSRTHQRAMAGALLCSLRLDAVRVLLAATWPAGRTALRDHFAQLTEQLFGVSAPPSLLGVVPQLRPGDGASLVGSLAAGEVRDRLVDRFDEDWFRNPAAIASLRHDDTLPRPQVTLDEAALGGAVDRAARRADDLLA